MKMMYCLSKQLSGTEECDDGNQNDGDGCSAECSIEVGWTCYHHAVPPYPCGMFEDTCTEVSYPILRCT